MMKLRTITRNSVLFLCVLSSVFAIQATTIKSGEGAFSIQYASQTSDNNAPAIEKVSYYGKEIPHVTLKQLVDEKQKNIVEHQDAQLKSWNRTYIAQTATFLGAGAAFIAHYINDDTVATFKKTDRVQDIAQKMGGVKPWQYKLAAASLVLGAATYPIARHWKLFGLNNFNEWYPSEEVEDTIVVFHKKVFSHSAWAGNTVVHYYNISDPIGYMTITERDKELAIVKKTSRRLHLSLLNATLGSLGLLWALVVTR